MGSVVEFNRRRAPKRSPRTAAAAAAREAEANKSLIGLIVAFSLAALAMTAAVVIAASDSWADAIPLLVCIFVIALAKIFLADALFYVMIRADAHSEIRAAEVRERRAGLVIRRPRNPLGGARRSRNAHAGAHIRAVASIKPAPPAGRSADPKHR